MARHARSRQARINAKVWPVLTLLSFVTSTVMIGAGLGLYQGLAWLLAFAASPLAGLLVGFGLTESLTVEDARRVFEAQIKLSAVYGVGMLLAYLVVLARAPLAQSGGGLVAATLVAIASWTLLAEIVAILSWDRLRRRYEP